MCDEEQDLDASDLPVYADDLPIDPQGSIFHSLTFQDDAWRETLQANARVICRIFSISPQELGAIAQRSSTKQECREALFHLIVSLSILPPP